MPFWRPEFLILITFCLLSLRLASGPTARKLILSLTGLYFYAWWDYRFLPLLPGLALIDWYIAQRIQRSPNPITPFSIGIALHLGVLGFFKYAGFFLGQWGDTALPGSTLWLILPLGLSFQQFQSITYLAAVRSGQMTARRSFLDILAFTCFFPCLTAGPIPRARNLIPQLDNIPKPNALHIYEGLTRFSIGAFKKLVLADRVAPYVAEVFSNPGLFDAPTIWAATLAYTLQIYLDFSGYSDMALGVARALGIQLPENFNYPYLAKNMSDFWRRWHISLSAWLRDYLYIPLGGSRCSLPRNLANAMIVMAICGIWHGAGWNFLLWGALHGIGLCVLRLWKSGNDIPPTALSNLLSWGLNFVFVMLCWIPFRAADLHQTWEVIKGLAGNGQIFWIPPALIITFTVTVAAHAWRTFHPDKQILPVTRNWVHPASVFTLLWLTVLFHAEGFTPFMYAQF